MIPAIVDTNILVEIYRRRQTAPIWLAEQPRLGVGVISWFEFVGNVRGKAGQAKCLEIVREFELYTLTDADQRWAMDRLLELQFSHGTSFKDSLIASVAYRLQIPIYTQNVKDFVPLLGTAQVIKPY